MSEDKEASTRPNKLSVQKLVFQSLQNNFHEKTVPAIGMAYAFNEEYPEQTDNQVRNALTHYSRALYDCTTMEEVEKEIASAEGHLERGVRDAMKLVLITLGTRINNLYNSILHAGGNIPPDTFKAYSGFRSARNSLYSYETFGQLDNFNSINKLDAGRTPFENVVSMAIEVEQLLLQATYGTDEASYAVLKTAHYFGKTKRFFTGTFKWVSLLVLGFFLRDLYTTAEAHMHFLPKFMETPQSHKTVDENISKSISDTSTIKPKSPIVQPVPEK